MKRAALIFLLLAAVTTAAVDLLGDELFAAPVESEELSLPDISPSVITPDVPTFVTIVFPKVIAEGTRDPALDLVKSPKLQYFDSNKGKWKTLVPMKDNGKFPDLQKDDWTALDSMDS